MLQFAGEILSKYAALVCLLCNVHACKRESGSTTSAGEKKTANLNHFLIHITINIICKVLD